MIDPPSKTTLPPEPVPVRQHVALLVDDFRTMARAEIGYYRTRLSYSAGVAKSVGIFVGLALFCFIGAFFALVLGSLLALGQAIGYVAATAVVVLSLLAVTVLFALLARNNARKLSFPEIEDKVSNG